MKIEPDNKRNIVISSEFEGDIAVVQESDKGLSFKLSNSNSPSNWYYLYLDSKGNLHVNNCTEREVIVHRASLPPPSEEDLVTYARVLESKKKSVTERLVDLVHRKEKKCDGKCSCSH